MSVCDAATLAKTPAISHDYPVLETSDQRRRWLGILFLAIAAGLLIWGQTVFREHLGGLAYVAYYAICLLFTVMAICTAIIDLWVIRHRTRTQRRELIQRALGSMSAVQRTAANSLPPSGSP